MPQQVLTGRSYVNRRAERATGISLAPPRDRPDRLTWARAAPSGASSPTRSAPLPPNFSHAPPGAVRAHVSRSGQPLALGICPWHVLHSYIDSYGPRGPPEEHYISARSRTLREVEIAPRSHVPQQVPAGRSYVHRRAERASGISLAPGIAPNCSSRRARRRAAHCRHSMQNGHGSLISATRRSARCAPM